MDFFHKIIGKKDSSKNSGEEENCDDFVVVRVLKPTILIELKQLLYFTPGPHCEGWTTRLNEHFMAFAESISDKLFYFLKKFYGTLKLGKSSSEVMLFTSLLLPRYANINIPMLLVFIKI